MRIGIASPSIAGSMISLYVFALIGAGVFTLLPGRTTHTVVFGQ